MHPSSFLSALAILLPLASARPANPLAPRFAGGWCTFHITQHQRNERNDLESGPDYNYDIRIFDSAKAVIGQTNGLAVPDLQTRSVDSELPATIDITSGLLDVDPITFSYSGQHWNSASGRRV
ncbi:MAG: hypothetical protein L6R37_003219 [Teloschistes peruensis]|nr:MAG: hypothetical protein L6R37_003219 [Teloschistes peruensis]